MGKKKTEEPIVVNPNEPLRKCYDCIHWHMHQYPDGQRDFSTGSCDHNGYSKCPPLFTCNGWESGNGPVMDNIDAFYGF